MSGRRNRTWFAAVALTAVGLAGCDGGVDVEADGEVSMGLTERIESSEDCAELEQIRAEQSALAEEQDGSSAHTGYTIAARARMTVLGCDDGEVSDTDAAGIQPGSMQEITETEDCDRLAEIRAERQAKVEEEGAASVSAGYVIAAEARMEELGCEINEG